MTAEATRTCTRCERALPVAAFARRKRGGAALQAWCRDCINATRRDARARRKENPNG